MTARHFLAAKRTAVKFCGITTPQDAIAAGEAGADAVGMVFYPLAKVAIDAEAGGEIMRALPPPVCGVALFVNADAGRVRDIINIVRPHLLQFHGDEDAAFCTSFGLPYLKACRVAAAGDIATTCAAHPQAAAVLADNKAGGGSGRVFDWDLLPPSLPLPLVIAGGLFADNVGDAVVRFSPFAVDVSGGIAEDGDRRRKECGKMRAFIKAVRDAENNNR
ncbi:MAG: phosphoribosylanthranilate isomerase [Gammaproteobacteria bacterium]